MGVGRVLRLPVDGHSHVLKVGLGVAVFLVGHFANEDFGGVDEGLWVSDCDDEAQRLLLLVPHLVFHPHHYQVEGHVHEDDPDHHRHATQLLILLVLVAG